MRIWWQVDSRQCVISPIPSLTQPHFFFHSDFNGKYYRFTEHLARLTVSRVGWMLYANECRRLTRASTGNGWRARANSRARILTIYVLVFIYFQRCPGIWMNSCAHLIMFKYSYFVFFSPRLVWIPCWIILFRRIMPGISYAVERRPNAK